MSDKKLKVLDNLLVLAVISLSVAAGLFRHAIIGLDKRTHHLVLYMTIVACVISGLYGIAKPNLDYQAAIKELPPGLRDEEEGHRVAKQYEANNKWKTEILLAFSLLLLVIIGILSE